MSTRSFYVTEFLQTDLFLGSFFREMDQLQCTLVLIGKEKLAASGGPVDSKSSDEIMTSVTN